MNQVSIGSGNGFSPIRRQAIIWTNAGLFSIGPLGTNCSEILIKIQNFSFMTMHLKISSAKWQPFCPRGDELMENHKYSLLMHRIKIKSPANSLWNEQHVFVCWFITFQSVLLWWYYNDKKPTGYWQYYHSRCRLPGCYGTRHGAWRPHHERQGILA